jgi:hypothetical protein
MAFRRGLPDEELEELDDVVGVAGSSPGEDWVAGKSLCESEPDAVPSSYTTSGPPGCWLGPLIFTWGSVNARCQLLTTEISAELVSS